jgi:maltose alpha-D-glucosyltransferase/alpha-amylase
MSAPTWSPKSIIYELYVDKFAGNFSGLTTKLDYFNYLGIDTLWLLPHYPSPLVDGGYDISDYQNIRSDLGTMTDFNIFVKTAHAKGLKVLTDLVLNHTSDQHPWFIESKGSKTNDKRNWYMWSNTPDQFSQAFVHFADLKNNINWIFNEATGDYYYATFYKEQPDLNWDNPEVLEAMLKVFDFWLDCGVDGFRLDAIARLIKRDGTNCFALPENHEILKKIRSHLDTKYPGKVLMAESGGWIHEAKAFFGQGDECHLVINFPLAVHMLAAINHKNTDKIESLWSQAGQLPNNCQWGVFLTNHDCVDLFLLGNEEEKQQLAKKADPDGLFAQPDSQSIGARIAEICQGNNEDILWATQLLLSQPGVPIIYYGNEIGMRNANLPDKPHDTRLYVRGPFDWPEAEKQQSDPNSLLNSIKNLITSLK